MPQSLHTVDPESCIVRGCFETGHDRSIDFPDQSKVGPVDKSMLMHCLRALNSRMLDSSALYPKLRSEREII